jgi:hypothetical protein
MEHFLAWVIMEHHTQAIIEVHHT